MDPDSPLSFITFINSIVLLILLFCSAIISGTEVAFFSLSTKDLDSLSSKIKRKSLVELLLDKPKKLLATILITNNFINILIVLLFANLGEVFLHGLSDSIRFTVEVILITFLILLFGEVLPKVYASRNPIKFSNFIAKVIKFLSVILSPLSFPLIRLTSIIENRLGSKHSDFSVETLSRALELTANTDTTKNEKKIFEGIVTFGNTETVQIMKPRTDICAIAYDEPFEKVLQIIIKNGYSRNPVYKENSDHIIGILYAKDLLKHLDKSKFNWQDLLREPIFVPENKKLDDLLADFQERKNHMAIVVDEYGGTSGLVTLEDVIEEIVGDINDEFDNEDFMYSKIDEHTYIFEAKTSVKDFCGVFNEDEAIFEEEKGESETLAGFILEVSGKFPKRGEVIKFKNYTFTIESLDRKRIKKIKVTFADLL